MSTLKYIILPAGELPQPGGVAERCGELDAAYEEVQDRL